MDDLEDVFEAVIDVEDVVEEVFEPEELLEDLVEDPLEVLFALAAAAAALFTLLVVAVGLLLVTLRYGLVPLLGVLAGLGLLATALAVAAFVYVRTDVPRRVERRLERARERTGSSETSLGAKRDDGVTTEADAIDRLREQYAQREITVRELERRLEAVMQSDDPERVLRSYEDDRGYEDEDEQRYEDERAYGHDDEQRYEAEQRYEYGDERPYERD